MLIIIAAIIVGSIILINSLKVNIDEDILKNINDKYDDL